MKVCTCFLLFGIFAYTHSFASNTNKLNQRSVKLALETVLEFSNKDKDVDIKFLNNVQNFITKVKTVIDENSNVNNVRRNFKAPRVKTFTGFVQDIIHILNTYDDTAFADFFNILDEEIRNYHYRGCRFYELTDNYEIRKLIAAKLDSIKGKPTSVTKARINALSEMLTDDNYDSNFNEIMHYINSLYRQAGENFQKVINDLEAYGRPKSKTSINDLGKIIKNGVRSIIFDHYTNLNTNVRRDVKEKIETFWKQFKKNKPKVKHYYTSGNNAKNAENTMNESEPNIVNNKVEFIRKHENNEAWTEIKQSEFKKPEMQRDDMKNEKKLYKYSRKDTVAEPLDTQEKEIKLSSQHSGPTHQQRTNYKHQEQPNIDSLSGESFSSIEVYHEPQHNATQNEGIFPVKIYQKPSLNATKKPEKIEALKLTTRTMPTNNTVKKIWIEESTVRLPQAVLDKLATKSSRQESSYKMTEQLLNKHGSKQKKKYDKDQKKWHGTKYETKYDKQLHKNRMTKHWSKNGTNYESRQKQKLKQGNKHKIDTSSEPNDPFILVHNRDFFRQNYVRTTDSVFNMEVQRYKKSLWPLRVQLKQNKSRTASTKAQKYLKVIDVLMPPKSGKTNKSPQGRRTAASRINMNEIKHTRKSQQTSPPPPTNSSMGRLAVAVSRAYPKRNKMLSWKIAEHSSSSNEGMAVKKTEIKDYKRHGHIAKRTTYSLEIDTQVIKRINNLERQLNEIKNRFNVNTDELKPKKFKHSHGVNDDVVKRKQSETKFNSDVINILDDYKTGQHKSKMAGTAGTRTERLIENKNVKGINSTNYEIEDDLVKGKKSVTMFRSGVKMIPNDFKNRTDKTKVAENTNYRTNVNNKDFKIIKETVDYNNVIEKVTKQQEIINKERKPEISLTNIGDVSPKDKDKGIKVMMNYHDGDDASIETGTLNRNISSLSTSTKATECITTTTTTVQPTVAVTTPTTLKLLTTSVSIPDVTSLKLADVLHKADFNTTVNESKNKMANNTSQVADVSKTTLSVTTKEVTS